MTRQVLLTTLEVAQRLDVDVRTVIGWADTGWLDVALRYPSMTGPRMFDAAEVERFAAERERGAAS